jgi:hypothetical protein
MNIQNMVRTSAVVVGMGAALLFTSSVQAQEIENTIWPDGANVAPFEQPAAVTAAQNSRPAQVVALEVKKVSEKISDVAPQAASLIQQVPVYGLLIALAPTGLAFVAVSSLLKVKRGSATRGRNSHKATPAGLKSAA